MNELLCINTIVLIWLIIMEEYAQSSFICYFSSLLVEGGVFAKAFE